MLKIFIIICSFAIPIKSFAEMLVLEERSSSSDGVTKNYILEVNIKDIKTTPKLNPAIDVLPISMKRAIKLATSAYKSKFSTKPWGIASVSLNHFPSYDYRNHWYFKVDFFGKPSVTAAVLLNEKIIFPREQ